jgi:hypothetical protein
MAKSNDELVIEIKGDISDLEKKLDIATDKVNAVGEKTDQSFRKGSDGVKVMSGSMKVFAGVAVGATAAIVGFNAAMDKVSSTAGLARMAERVGVNIEKFQELSFAAKSIGVNSEVLADAMKDLNVKITDASLGAQAYEDALNAVGLKSADLVGLSMDKQFEAFADAIAGASREMGNFAADEINDSMYRMVPLMRDGAEGMRKLGEKARDIGAVLSSKEIQEITAVNRNFEILKATTEALATKLVNALTPALQGIITVATDAANAVGKLNETAEDIQASSYADEVAAQEGKIKELKQALFDANAELLAFDSSWGKAFGLTTDSELKLEVDLLNQSLENAKIKLEELKTAKESAGLSSGGDGGGGASDIDEDPNFDSDVLGGATSPEEDEEVARQRAIQEILRADKEEHLLLMEELEQDARDSRAALDLQTAEDKAEALAQELKDFEEAEERKKQKKKEAYEAGKKALRDLSTLMRSENRKAFEVGKAAAIANTTIKTAESAMGAYNAMVGIPYVGPALGAAAAAAAIAYGAQQISAISSTSFNGGGGGGGGGGPAVVSSSDGGEAQAPQQVQNVTEATINITGDNISGDSARALVAQLREYQEDGGELLIK